MTGVEYSFINVYTSSLVDWSFGILTQFQPWFHKDPLYGTLHNHALRNNSFELIQLSSPSRIKRIEWRADVVILFLALWRRKSSKTGAAASNSPSVRQALTLRRCESLAWSTSLSPSSLAITMLNPSLWGSNKVSHLSFRHRPQAHKNIHF